MVGFKDVCDVLELTDTRRVAERLDDDERSLTPLVDKTVKSQEMWVVNEPGLYNVIIRSDKPEAKMFKRWVTHEILPSVRKHGAFITPAKLEEIMNDPDAWITVLSALKEERAAKDRLMLEAAESKPKVLFADAVSASKNTVLVGELAKILKQNGVKIGQNRLLGWLRENEYLIRRKGTDFNMPTQKSMELGLFVIKETAITHSDGHTSINKTAKVTGKGQVYFINKFVKSGRRLCDG